MVLKISMIGPILGAVTIGIVTAFVISWYQKRNKLKPPTVWEPVGVVKKLYLYPLKSGKAIELQTALCTEAGLKTDTVLNDHQLRDRSFVVYNEIDKNFQTARSIPKLVLVAMSAVDHNRVQLAAPSMSNLMIMVPDPFNNERVAITHHSDEKIPAIDCGNEAAKWISQYASESSLRLAYHDGKERRNIEESHKKHTKAYPRVTNAATGLQSDFSSYLLINEASVKDVYDKVSEVNVSALNFRPNILIEGPSAFAEDNWAWVKVGNVILYTAMLCTRCLLTTVDPSTGVKSERNEPLKTLRTYRKLKDVKNISVDGNLPVMGISMGYHSGDSISVGDTVYVPH